MLAKQLLIPLGLMSFATLSILYATIANAEECPPVPGCVFEDPCDCGSGPGGGGPKSPCPQECGGEMKDCSGTAGTPCCTTPPPGQDPVCECIENCPP
jgi:hypothetical protein